MRCKWFSCSQYERKSTFSRKADDGDGDVSEEGWNRRKEYYLQGIFHCLTRPTCFC